MVLSRIDPTTLHRVAARLATHTPVWLSHRAVRVGAHGASLLAGDRRVLSERHLERAGLQFDDDRDRRRAVGRALGSYGRYYTDSFRLPSLSRAEVDAGFRYDGFSHITDAIATGTGPLLVLPHLGGWEWAAFWLAVEHQIRVTGVVEPLEPPELFEWFASFRESIGMRVVPVGPDAAPAILNAINRAEVVCLLADRVVAGATAVPVTFFGERTLLPAGPATLALRTGAALLPTAVYFDGAVHRAEVRPPVPAVREGTFRSDVIRVTQLLADELERFIRAAPEQWHALQPIWPSDYRALGRPVPASMKDL